MKTRQSFHLLPWTRVAFLLLSICAFFGAARPAAAADGASTVVWKTDAVSVTALLDRQGGMDIGLFSGPATPEERQKYFTDGKAPSSINVFLIRANGKHILVDTGFGDAVPGESGLVPRLAQMGLLPEHIDFILLTHMHMDHIGGLLQGGSRAFPKAKVMAAGQELDYWLNMAAERPDNANAVLAKAVAREYGTDLAPFAEPGAILPGLTLVDAFGHTPGHTVFLLESGGKSLLILGDLLHAAALQFPLPDECPSYDIDPAKATEARRRIFDMAAEKNISVAGMHIPFPGTGSVTKEGKGYTFTPLGK